MSAAAAELPGSTVDTGIRPEKGWSKTMYEKKTYTLEDFEMNTYTYKPIEDYARRDSYGRFTSNINYSGILTRLIQEAGRYCEHYASDLFIDWEAFVNYLDRDPKAGDNRTFLFGFRQNGVDHDLFIFSRFNNDGIYARNEYRSMWRLDIDVTDDELTMTLGRVF